MQISRRDLMTGAAAVALAGVPVAVDAVEPDPAIEAARNWLAARDAKWAAYARQADDAEIDRLGRMEWDAQYQLDHTAPTTTVGVVAKLAVAVHEFRLMKHAPNLGGPDYDEYALYCAALDAARIGGHDLGWTMDDAASVVRQIVGGAV